MVRVPLNCRLFDAGPDGAAAWRVLDRLLRWCEKHDVYVVLDLHAVPGGQSKLGMADPGTLATLSGSPRRIRRRLWRSGKGLRPVTRIEGSSQGTTSSTSLHRHREATSSDCTNGSSGRRQSGPDHLIIVEGSKLASDLSVFDKPLCRNQVFSFHIYTWFGDDRKKKLAAYRAFARKHNTPLWVGEFGRTPTR